MGEKLKITMPYISMKIFLFKFLLNQVFKRKLLEHPVSLNFKGEDLTIDGVACKPDELVKLTKNVTVTVEGLSKLFMLPNKSTIWVESQFTATEDKAPPGIYCKSLHTWNLAPHENSVGLYELKSNSSGVFLSGVFIDHIFMDKSKTPSNYGAVAFSHLALKAYEEGLTEITLLAGGGAPQFAQQWGIPDMIGFIVWPKFGFDAPLEQAEIQKLPSHLQGCTSVSCIVAKDPEWWAQIGGNGRVMKFDLTPWSKSWKTLLYYMYGVMSKKRS